MQFQVLKAEKNSDSQFYVAIADYFTTIAPYIRLNGASDIFE